MSFFYFTQSAKSAAIQAPALSTNDATERPPFQHMMLSSSLSTPTNNVLHKRQLENPQTDQRRVRSFNLGRNPGNLSGSKGSSYGSWPSWIPNIFSQGMIPSSGNANLAPQNANKVVKSKTGLAPGNPSLNTSSSSFWLTPDSGNTNLLAGKMKNVPATDPSPATGKPSTTNSKNLSKDSSEAQKWMEYHNKVRVLYGSPNLVWNEDLVKAAKRATDTCAFKHTANNKYGENIAAGQTTAKQVVDLWVNGPNEKDVYDPANPRFSHYTQVVWKGTTELGCAMTTCEKMTGINLPQSPVYFWACEYNPPGNYEGQYAANVQATRGGNPLRKVRD